MKPLTQEHSAGAAAEPGEEARAPLQMSNVTFVTTPPISAEQVMLCSLLSQIWAEL